MFDFLRPHQIKILFLIMPNHPVCFLAAFEDEISAGLAILGKSRIKSQLKLIAVCIQGDEKYC